MTKWKVSCRCLTYTTVAETAEEAKKIASEQWPIFSDPEVQVTVKRCPDKVYLVYRDYHSEACDDALLQVCATEEAAQRWIASIPNEQYRKDCYIEDMEVFE